MPEASPMNRLHIRPISAEDAPLARNVAAAVLYPECSPEDLPGVLRSLPGSVRDTGGEMWVAVVDDAVIGTLALHPHGGSCLEMQCLALVPAWRGLGIEQLLLQNALPFAAGKNATAIQVEVNPEETTRREALTELGFTETVENATRPGFLLMRLSLPLAINPGTN